MATPLVYSQAIPNMSPGLRIEILGGTILTTSRFDINLKTRGAVEIPLHISFRFQEHPRCIVRNTLDANSSWGHEERSGNMPIAPGTPFKILLECKSSAISIYINSQLFCHYAHRVPYFKINHLTIQGDVLITGVTMR